MRCICCNKMLNDYESTRKLPDSNEYADMCNVCFSFVGIIVDDYVDTPEDTDTTRDKEEFNTIIPNEMFNYEEFN